MEQTGMLVGNFEFNPKATSFPGSSPSRLLEDAPGDGKERTLGMRLPLKETIWAWLRQILTLKRDRLKTHKYDMQ